jgi:hypothetical protein
MQHSNAQRADNIQRTNPEKEQKNDPAAAPSPREAAKPPRKKTLNKSQIEGLVLRRNLGMDRKNRDKKTVYIEHEILEALGPDKDLNFAVNLALEYYITQGPEVPAMLHLRIDQGIKHLVMDLERVTQDLKQLKDQGPSR